MEPEGWPGHIWLEGRTTVHLQNHQPKPSHMPRGPAAKTGEGFLNPAMAPARTRSVMLLADAIENGWLVPEGKTIRALDALCATGVRPRRWRKEIPSALVMMDPSTSQVLPMEIWMVKLIVEMETFLLVSSTVMDPSNGHNS